MLIEGKYDWQTKNWHWEEDWYNDCKVGNLDYITPSLYNEEDKKEAKALLDEYLKIIKNARDVYTKGIEALDKKVSSRKKTIEELEKENNELKDQLKMLRQLYFPKSLLTTTQILNKKLR